MTEQPVSDAIVRHLDTHAATLQRKAREYEAAGNAQTVIEESGGYGADREILWRALDRLHPGATDGQLNAAITAVLEG